MALLVAAALVWVASSRGSHGAPAGGVSTAGTPVDRAAFAPGACIAYPPLSRSRHRTVFLDAGHGGLDPGSVGTTSAGRTVYEADLTLPVELDTMRTLRRAGFRVVVSRTRNSSVARLHGAELDGTLLTARGVHADVAARDICANAARASILVGIYFDAGGPGNAGSVTAYDAVRPFAGASLRLAALVQHDVLNAMNRQGWGIPDEGVQRDDQLGSSINSNALAYGHLLLLGPAKRGYFDTPSRMPGALIEPLFITDPFEASIAASVHGQHVIAAGIAQAVRQYFRGSRRRPVAGA